MNGKTTNPEEKNLFTINKLYTFSRLFLRFYFLSNYIFTKSANNIATCNRTPQTLSFLFLAGTCTAIVRINAKLYPAFPPSGHRRRYIRALAPCCVKESEPKAGLVVSVLKQLFSRLGCGFKTNYYSTRTGKINTIAQTSQLIVL